MYVLHLETRHDHLLLHVCQRVAEPILPQYKRDLVAALLYKYLIRVKLDLN